MLGEGVAERGNRVGARRVGEGGGGRGVGKGGWGKGGGVRGVESTFKWIGRTRAKVCVTVKLQYEGNVRDMILYQFFFSRLATIF